MLKVSMLEKDGVEFDVATEIELTDAAEFVGIPTTPGTPSTVNTSSTNSQGSGPEFSYSDHIHKVELSRQVATSTTEITTTSTSFTSLGLDMTPVAGTYLALLGVNLVSNVSGTNNVSEFGIFIAGTSVASSLKEVGINASGISLASFRTQQAAYTSAIITVNGSQLVQAGWRRSQGSTTHTASERELILLRLQ